MKKNEQFILGALVGAGVAYMLMRQQATQAATTAPTRRIVSSTLIRVPISPTAAMGLKGVRPWAQPRQGAYHAY